jgi:hypothetical protein
VGADCPGLILVTGLALLQSPQRVDEAEPADEPLVVAPVGAQPARDRLAVQVNVEPDAQHPILVGALVVEHRRRLYAGVVITRVGEVPYVSPDSAAASACLLVISSLR